MRGPRSPVVLQTAVLLLFLLGAVLADSAGSQDAALPDSAAVPYSAAVNSQHFQHFKRHEGDLHDWMKHRDDDDDEPGPEWPLLNSMVALFGYYDYILDDKGSSSCIRQVRRIADRMGVQTPHSSVKISPFFNYNWELPSNAVAGEDQYYRHWITSWLINGPNADRQPTAEHVQEYVAGLSACITTAINLGFKHLFINPMIDPNYKTGGAWRNAAEFNPLEKQGDWSYETLVAQPTMEALNQGIQAATNHRSPSISFGLGAEQGRSWTVFAGNWDMLLKELKNLVNPTTRTMSVGPHFDPLKLCGYYCDYYSEQTKVTDEQWAAFRTFMAAVNEFGVSSYPQVWENYDIATQTLDMAQSARAIDEQLQEFAGLSVRGLRAAGKKWVFNEVGVGGCVWFGCGSSDQRAPDIYALSINAYNGEGSFNGYSNDANKNFDPFYYRWALAFKQEWWRGLLSFMSGHHKTDNPEYIPDAAYVWIVGSWDIAAIYHGSTFAQDPDGIGCNPMKSYCDPTILKVVKAYNAHCAVPKEAFFPLPGPGYCRSQTVDYREVCTPPGTARKAPERPRNVDPNRVRSPIDPSTVPPEALGAMFTRTRVD